MPNDSERLTAIKQAIAIKQIKDGKNNRPDGKKQGALLSFLKGEEPGGRARFLWLF